METKKADARIKSAVNKPARLALFGGSFDPVHRAHLKVAHCALQQACVDRVVFIPASRSPLKHKPFAEDVDRLQMLRLALKGEAGIGLDMFEIGQKGTSFTIDTVDHFRALYKNAELFWIIGQDQLSVEDADVAEYAMLGELDMEHSLLADFADIRFNDFTKIHIWNYR